MNELRFVLEAGLDDAAASAFTNTDAEEEEGEFRPGKSESKMLR